MFISQLMLVDEGDGTEWVWSHHLQSSPALLGTFLGSGGGSVCLEQRPLQARVCGVRLLSTRNPLNACCEGLRSCRQHWGHPTPSWHEATTRYLWGAKGPQGLDTVSSASRKKGAAHSRVGSGRRAGKLTCQCPVPTALSCDLSIHKVTFIVTPIFKQQLPPTW